MTTIIIKIQNTRIPVGAWQIARVEDNLCALIAMIVRPFKIKIVDVSLFCLFYCEKMIKYVYNWQVMPVREKFQSQGGCDVHPRRQCSAIQNSMTHWKSSFATFKMTWDKAMSLKKYVGQY